MQCVRRSTDADIELVLLASALFMVGYFVPGDPLAEDRRRTAGRACAASTRWFSAASPATTSCPIRIGEVVRAGWLSREAPMPGGRALGSVALDRVCDVVTLVLFLVVGLQAVPTPTWLRNMIVGAVILVLLIVAALVFARLYTRSRGRDRRERGRVRRIVRDTIDFLGEPIGRHRAAVWLALSIVAWSIGAVAVYLVARSVGVELEPLEAVFVASALALGVAIPSSPGYIGTYQLIARRVARPPRRRREPGARLLDPHARELVRADHACRRSNHRLAGAADALRRAAEAQVASASAVTTPMAATPGCG